MRGDAGLRKVREAKRAVTPQRHKVKDKGRYSKLDKVYLVR